MQERDYCDYEESFYENSGLKRFLDEKGISAFWEKNWRKIVTALILVLLIGYIPLYRQKGILFSGDFYRPQQLENGIYFEDADAYSDFSVYVEWPGNRYCNVTYIKTDRGYSQQTVHKKNYQLEMISSNELVIYENDKLLFEGSVEKTTYDDIYYLKSKDPNADDWGLVVHAGIAPDELDGVSSITDVLIDGIFLDDTCQGIRMLSKKDGRLDRVTVKNVTGTYRTFGFSIIPFYPGENFGNVGDLYFENIDLRQIPETYHYTPLTFFQLGGNIECVTMKNIRFHNPVRNNVVFDIGRPFHYCPPELPEEEIELYQLGSSIEEYKIDWMPLGARPHIKNFIIDGLTIINDNRSDDTEIFELRYKIDNFIAKNIQVFRTEDSKSSGNLIKLADEAEINNLIVEDVFAEKLESIIVSDESNKVKVLKAKNITLKDGESVLLMDKAIVDKTIISDVEEIK